MQLLIAHSFMDDYDQTPSDHNVDCMPTPTATWHPAGDISYHIVLPMQEFYDIACSDSKAIRRFHIEVKKDETVTVSEWEQKARVVTFTMDMAIPTSLKRFVGK